MSENQTIHQQARVINIGVTSEGKSVVRLIHDGRRIDIATDLNGFAALAAAGVKVENGGK